MVNIVRQQIGALEQTVDTGDYQDFKGLKFKVIKDLPPGQYLEFVTEEPTYIEQSTGDITVIARAPTMIKGGTGRIIIDGYAPLLVRGSTAGMDAYLRENTAIEGVCGVVNIIAAHDLELIAEKVMYFMGEYHEFGSVHLNPLCGNRGKILFKGGANRYNFKYQSRLELHLPKDSGLLRIASGEKALLE